MTSPAVLTIPAGRLTAGTAKRKAKVKVFPAASESIIVQVYDPGSQTYRLVRADASQMWFWSSEWQAMEREADEDLRQGRYEDFGTMEEFISSL